MLQFMLYHAARRWWRNSSLRQLQDAEWRIMQVRGTWRRDYWKDKYIAGRTTVCVTGHVTVVIGRVHHFVLLETRRFEGKITTFTAGYETVHDLDSRCRFVGFAMGEALAIANGIVPALDEWVKTPDFGGLQPRVLTRGLRLSPLLSIYTGWLRGWGPTRDDYS